MCANLVYNLNGNKAPNAVGKDIGFITVMYSTNLEVLAPMPQTTDAATDKKQNEAAAACKAQDSESRLPSKDELASMFYNAKLISISQDLANYWSVTVVSSGASGKAWYLGFNGGYRKVEAKTNTYNVRCLKK